MTYFLREPNPDGDDVGTAWCDEAEKVRDATDLVLLLNTMQPALSLGSEALLVSSRNFLRGQSSTTEESFSDSAPALRDAIVNAAGLESSADTVLRSALLGAADSLRSSAAWLSTLPALLDLPAENDEQKGQPT